MANEKNYSVYQGDDGQWKGKRDDASRASVTGRTQKEVIDATRELTKKTRGEMSIHRGDNGKIRDKHSYGNDPKNVPG